MLRRVLPSYMATDPLEVIIVDDGSGPADRPTLEALGRLTGVRVIHGPHRGLPASRNEGAKQATGEWIVFGEDDVWFTPEYPRILIEHAVQAESLVASGLVPLVDPALLFGSTDELEARIRATPMRDRTTNEILGVPWPAEVLASEDVVTPLLTAVAAVHRTVFERVRFDPRFGGNAFREETDFFLSCFEAGIRTLHCPHAVSGHMKVHARAVPGGSWAMSRLRYALQMNRNNWRFIAKHARTLSSARRQAGRRGGSLTMQAEFLLSMVRRLRPTVAALIAAPGGSRSSKEPPP
jgi:glycosyltransferase involved in cell wall biosynthesis